MRKTWIITETLFILYNYVNFYANLCEKYGYRNYHRWDKLRFRSTSCTHAPTCPDSTSTVRTDTPRCGPTSTSCPRLAWPHNRCSCKSNPPNSRHRLDMSLLSLPQRSIQHACRHRRCPNVDTCFSRDGADFWYHCYMLVRLL